MKMTKEEIKDVIEKRLKRMEVLFEKIINNPHIPLANRDLPQELSYGISELKYILKMF